MQKFLLNLAGLGLLTSALIFSSCEPDPVDPVDQGPTIAFLEGTDILSADADLFFGEKFTVKIKVDKGDAPLRDVEVREAGDKIATDRLIVNGGAISGVNPFLTLGADADGATYEIEVDHSVHAVGHVILYDFIITDTNGKTANKDIQITTIALPGTALDTTLTGVLFNQSGPGATGGLDLDGGIGTASADPSAEIRDLGIDCTLPAASNWRAQIGTINNANMVKVDQTQIENFTFDNVDKKEVILDAYTSGTTLADGQNVTCGGTVTPVTDVSDAVVVGDMFVVFANNIYYLIRVDAVNVTTNDNADNYTLSIKY